MHSVFAELGILANILAWAPIQVILIIWPVWLSDHFFLCLCLLDGGKGKV